jgi:hypothetical protein
MRTVTNDAPPVLLNVARDAMRLGITEVSLGFMYMGSGFLSPIEWALHLTKRENRFDAPAGSPAAPRVHVTLTMQRNDDAPKAYVGDEDGTSDNPYWNVDQVTSWMHESIEADGEYIPAWAPVTDVIMQEHLLARWDLFREGVRSGWTMTHKAQWSDLVLMNKLFGDQEGAAQATLPQTNLRWHMTNTFYNEETHPSYRGEDDDNGAPLSVSGYSFRRTSRDGSGHAIEAFRALGTYPYSASISVEEMHETLHTTAPWFVRVADYDLSEEEWIHFAEATDWKTSVDGAARAIADTQRARALGEVPVTT